MFFKSSISLLIFSVLIQSVIERRFEISDYSGGFNYMYIRVFEGIL